MTLIQESKDLIIVSYLPGEGGQVIGRIINNSLSTGPADESVRDDGDAAWENILDRVRVLETKPSKHKTRSLSNSIYLLPAGVTGPAATDPETVRRALSILKTLDIGDSRHCLTTHARPQAIRELFPYCRIVLVSDKDKNFSIRAHYEKKVRGHKRKREILKREIRYRGNLTRFRRAMEHQEDPRLIVIKRSRLLSDDWKSEYNFLCSFLHLDPEYEKNSSLIEQWLNKQWTRPIL